MSDLMLMRDTTTAPKRDQIYKNSPSYTPRPEEPKAASLVIMGRSADWKRGVSVSLIIQATRPHTGADMGTSAGGWPQAHAHLCIKCLKHCFHKCETEILVNAQNRKTQLYWYGRRQQGGGWWWWGNMLSYRGSKKMEKQNPVSQWKITILINKSIPQWRNLYLNNEKNLSRNQKNLWLNENICGSMKISVAQSRNLWLNEDICGDSMKTLWLNDENICDAMKTCMTQ